MKRTFRFVLCTLVCKRFFFPFVEKIFLLSFSTLGIHSVKNLLSAQFSLRRHVDVVAKQEGVLVV